ncbi:MAG: hypothetical protein AVDCRST_MAG50-2242, partial [uncultured Acidimicrobiales bacterium]
CPTRQPPRHRTTAPPTPSTSTSCPTISSPTATSARTPFLTTSGAGYPGSCTWPWAPPASPPGRSPEGPACWSTGGSRSSVRHSSSWAPTTCWPRIRFASTRRMRWPPPAGRSASRWGMPRPSSDGVASEAARRGASCCTRPTNLRPSGAWCWSTVSTVRWWLTSWRTTPRTGVSTRAPRSPDGTRPN